MAGFTARIENGYKAEVSCRGANHRDHGVFGRCDACIATVVKTEKGVFDTHMSGGNYPVETFYCWRAHRCDAEQVARVAAEKASKIEAGEIVKGATVQVVKGRKVPKGTTGTVIWIGEGQWGWRVGIKDAAGETHWTALDNVAAWTMAA